MCRHAYAGNSEQHGDMRRGRRRLSRLPTQRTQLRLLSNRRGPLFSSGKRKAMMRTSWATGPVRARQNSPLAEQPSTKTANNCSVWRVRNRRLLANTDTLMRLELETRLRSIKQRGCHYFFVSKTLMLKFKKEF